MSEPFSGPALRYEHPDYLDEAAHANLKTAAESRLDLLSLADERGLVKTADILRPLFREWGDDPAVLLPYPTTDPRWQGQLARIVLDAFGGEAVPTDRIFFGDGTYELFKELAGFVLRKGVLLGAGPVYPEFAGYFAAAGGRFRAVLDPDDTGRFPAEALARAVETEPDAVAVYADLPYNATGGLPSRDSVLALVEHAARRDLLVVVDEAYANFLGPKPSFVGDVLRHDNLVVLRSLSKGFDLRGLRFGFVAAGVRAAAVIDRIRSPYAPSQPAARAALRLLTTAPDVVRPLTEAVTASKARILGAAAAKGLLVRPTHSATPNLMLRSPDARDPLGPRLARLGVRVGLGTQFASTADGRLDADVRFRVPLAEDRAALLTSVFAAL